MRFVLPLILFAAACSRGGAPVPEPAAAPEGPVALFVGDSLTAGYGVNPEEAWPALVGAEWERRGLPWKTRDAAVSGATSAGVAAQINWTITPDVKIIFICVGGNDGLRGISPAETRKNLSALIVGLKKRGVRVVLAGMKIPPNYGVGYTREFESLFPSLAQAYGLSFLPFLLDGVAAVPALNQEDGIHPNAEGHKRVSITVLSFFDKEGLLK